MQKSDGFNSNKIGKGWTVGQSFLELAILFPLLLLLLTGFVEVGYYIYSYMTALDLTREAARFASGRDFLVLDNPGGTVMSACEDGSLHFYLDTACFFTDSDLNPFIPISSTQFADVAISVFTISDNIVTNRWPDDGDGVWSLYNDNWQKDCAGNIIQTEPFMTNEQIESMFVPEAVKKRGIVLVEVYYCQEQILNLPLLNQFIPSPIRIQAYSLMPASEAIPTPTPFP